MAQLQIDDPIELPEHESLSNPRVPSSREIFDCYLLTLCFGVFFFLFLLAVYAKGGIVEKEEFHLFVYGWIFVPPLSIAAIFAIRKIKRRHFQEFAAFYPRLIIVNSIYLLVAIAILYRLTGQSTAPFRTLAADRDNLEFSSAIRQLVLAGVGVNLIAFAFFRSYRDRPDRPASDSEMESLLDRFWAFAAFILGGFFVYFTRAEDQTDFLFSAALGLAFALIRFPEPPARGRVRLAIDLFACLAIAALAFDAQLHVGMTDYPFFLGPVNKILGGGTLLVDTNCQYGVGLIYFLAAVFKSGQLPRTYAACSALISVLYILEYGMIYFFLRAFVRSVWLPFAAMFLLIILNNYSTTSYASASPSVGPLRFGLSFLLVAINLVRIRRPGKAGLCIAAEALVVGLASIWSLDTFLYTAVPFVAIVGYEALEPRKWRTAGLFALAARLALAAAGMLAFHAMLAIFTHARSGQWPHWSFYFDYIRLYTAQEFGTLLVNPWSPWVFPPLIYFASLMALGFRLYFYNDAPFVDGPVVAGLASAGAAQFIYFVGRSHINNLYHTCVPALMLSCYWLSWLARNPRTPVPAAIRQSCIFFFAFASLLVFYDGRMKINEKLPQSLFGQIRSAVLHPDKEYSDGLASIPGRIRKDPSPSPAALEAARLIDKYFKKSKSVPILFDPPEAAWALFTARKSEAFAFGYPIQDQIVPDAVNRILAAPLGLKAGDILLLGTDEVKLRVLQSALLATIRSKFNLTPLEPPTPDIGAYRLTDR